MKITEDENGVIHYHYNIFDRIRLWILRKTVWKFETWLSRASFYKELYYKFLWRFSKIEPFELNSFEEASINLNKEIRHEAVRKQLIGMKEEMGEEELLKMIKKQLNRREYKKYLKAIKKWKEKGKW